MTARPISDQELLTSSSDVSDSRRAMQFCHGDLSLPSRAWVPATYGNGSVEVTSVIDGGRPDAVWFAARRARRDPRRPQGQRYSLSHLLLFSVLAVLAGATSYQKII